MEYDVDREVKEEIEEEGTEHITEQDIKAALSRLKNGKAAG